MRQKGIIFTETRVEQGREKPMAHEIAEPALKETKTEAISTRLME
jgi:hypothetical protein